MPLDQHVADEVQFTCESCGREQAVRQLRKLNGGCVKCGDTTWRMNLTFHEGPVSMSPVALIMLWFFDVYVVGHVTQTIHLVTPKVLTADAAEIARFGWNYKRAACKYMELRRELDADSERQSMKDRGGTNCARCGVFFMPSSDKPWTHVGYCSKACFGSANSTGEDSPLLEVAAEQPEAKFSRTIAVVCKKGHGFEVAAMYAGTFRPCPVCKERTAVN